MVLKMAVSKILKTGLVLSSIMVLYISYCIQTQFVPEGISQPMKMKMILFVTQSVLSFNSLLGDLGLASDVQLAKSLGKWGASLVMNHNGIHVLDTVFEGVPVRVYTPPGLSDQERGKGMVYYHGGGFVIGSIDEWDPLTAMFAKEAKMVVVSVEYRLSPEYSQKDGLDDCISATKYFIQHADKFGVHSDRVVVAGDSAGGNYAAAVSLYLRDKDFKPMPKLQLLIYPSVQGIDLQLPSYQQNAKGPFFTRHMMIWFRSYVSTKSKAYLEYFDQNTHVVDEVRKSMSKEYLNHNLLPSNLIYPPYKPPVFQKGNSEVWNKLKDIFTDPYHCPLMAKDHSNLPEVYIFTGQYDQLRDEGFLYARRLSEAGVQVTHYNCPFGWHGMLNFVDQLDDSKQVFNEMVEFIKEHL